MDGADTVFVGPYNLGMSLRAAFPNSNTPTVEEALETVLKAAKKAGNPARIFAVAQNVESQIEEGFEFVLVGNDNGFLMTGAREAVKKAQNAVAKHR